MYRTIDGPSAVATELGSRRQMRGPNLKVPTSGDGVAASFVIPRPYHHSGSSRPPHCILKRWVPEPGVQRPKLNRRTPSADRTLHADPIKEHVGRFAAMGTERASPSPFRIHRRTGTRTRLPRAHPQGRHKQTSSLPENDETALEIGMRVGSVFRDRACGERTL